MRKSIAALTIAALTLAGAPSASAFSFGSSGSSFLGSSTPATPEERIRNAIENAYRHAGYEIAHDLTPYAQIVLISNDPAERSVARDILDEAGIRSGNGGSFYSDVDLLEERFATTGQPQPKNGLTAVVSVDYGIITTRYMVYTGVRT